MCVFFAPLLDVVDGHYFVVGRIMIFWQWHFVALLLHVFLFHNLRTLTHSDSGLRNLVSVGRHSNVVVVVGFLVAFGFCSCLASHRIK